MREFETYEVPSHWTPEHVMHRMVMAFITLQQIHDTVGPSRMKAAWPSIVRDQGDRNMAISAIGDETEDERNHRLSSDIWTDWERDVRADPHDIFLMEESFGWPGQYLDEPVQITRWAQRRAHDLTKRRDAPERESDMGIAIVFAEAKTICRGLKRDAVIVQHENFQT